MKEVNALKRVNHDLEVLYKQQISLQNRSSFKNIKLVKIQRLIEDKSYSNISLLCISVANPIRRYLIRTVLTRNFDYFILVVILANCILITLPEIMNISWQDTADLVFIIIYTTESILKIICMGFCIGKNTYLHDPWNILDFSVMVSGWIGLIFTSSSISVVRTIRILRPLRTFNSIPEMKILIVSIFRALPLLFDIFLLFFFSLFVFALIGVQIYGGFFSNQCFTSTGIPTSKLCFYSTSCNEFQINCGNSGCDINEYCWNSAINPNQGVTSFDNIFTSLLTVFIAVTLSGWGEIMIMGRKVLNQKILNDIYFIALIVIVSFFMVKLTVAAIYVKFIQTRGEQEKTFADATIWDSGPEELFVNKKSFIYKWYLLRVKCYHLSYHNCFEWGIVLIIALNTFIMASEYYQMTSMHFEIMNWLNMTFTIVFTFEMMIKLMGFGLKGYLSQAQNIFDGLLVLFGLVEIAAIFQHQNENSLNILRAVRILRIFKITRKWQGLRVIIEKLMNSTKSICYLGLITFITIFIYTLLGKRLFQGKLISEDGEIPRANFNNFFWSFVTVFQLVTGEKWDVILYNTVGPNGWIYLAYFISLIIICGYILLNLFIAILIEQFDENIIPSIDSDTLDLEKTIRYKERRMSVLDSKKIDIRRRAKIKMKFTEINFNGRNLLRPSGSSYFIFKYDNPFRVALKDIMLHPYFDSFIYSLILMSCATLLLDEPAQSDFTTRFLNLYSIVSLSFFILEFLLKSIVLGFIQGENSYLKNIWNIIDLAIILFSIADQVLITVIQDFSYIKAFRAVRALRPLRMVSHNENMRKVISSVFAAIPAVFNVMLVTLLFYIVFGIAGVIFFKGIMYSCNDPNILLETECFGNFINNLGQEESRQWISAPYNYDNFSQAILTLFSISTLASWPTYMYAVVDGVGQGIAEKRDYNQYAAIFYIVFIFLTDFFIMNLYLGAVIKKFNEIQEEIDGSFFLSSDQKDWVRTQKLLITCSPRIRYLRPKFWLRKLIFNFILDYKFEYLIQSVIIMNIVFMTLFNYPIDPELDNLENLANNIFVGIFSAEFFLKIIGLGIRYYFASKWNRFDFCILLVSLASFSKYLVFSNTIILRALRICRLFRILKVFKSFQSIIKTLMISLPSLINVGAILCLLWFIYGVAGTYLFGRLDYTNSVVLSDEINFTTFYNSFLVLFQAITGENWNLIMIDCMKYGCNNQNIECSSSISASLYWVSYIIVGQYFFFSLFIAVILENFITTQPEKPVAGLHHSDLKKFKHAWSIYAPYGELFIDTKLLPPLLQILESPLGFKGQNLNNSQMIHVISALGITDIQGKTHFAEVLWKLAHAVAGTDMSTAAPCEALRNIQKILPKRIASNSVDSDKNLAAKTLAVYVIINRWRKKRNKFVEKKSLVTEVLF